MKREIVREEGKVCPGCPALQRCHRGLALPSSRPGNKTGRRGKLLIYIVYELTLQTAYLFDDLYQT